MNRRRPITLLALGLTIGLVGCSSLSNSASDAATKALESATSTTTATPSSPTTKHADPCGPVDEGHLTASFRPDGLTPRTGPADDSVMGAIVQRGALEAGVDENTPPLSFRDPRSGDFEGFEIDLLHELAGSMLGTSAATARVTPLTVITSDKVPVVARGEVDMTASAVSITCSRWEQVDFTIPYFHAAQKVMVGTDRQGRPVLSDGSPLGTADTAAALNDALKGRRVSATAGSTSADAIDEKLPSAERVEVPARTDCLMALQRGTVDAILLHDTFLLGFEMQDPNTTILAPSLGEQYYGIAVHKGEEDLVRFLNRALVDMRGDSRLQALYEANFAGLYPPGELPPFPALEDPEWID